MSVHLNPSKLPDRSVLNAAYKFVNDNRRFIKLMHPDLQTALGNVIEDEANLSIAQDVLGQTIEECYAGEEDKTE